MDTKHQALQYVFALNQPITWQLQSLQWVWNASDFTIFQERLMHITQLFERRCKSTLSKRYFALSESLPSVCINYFRDRPSCQQQQQPKALNIDEARIHRYRHQWQTDHISTSANFYWVSDQPVKTRISHSVDRQSWGDKCITFQALMVKTGKEGGTLLKAVVAWLKQISHREYYDHQRDRLAFIIVFHLVYLKWINRSVDLVIAGMFMFDQVVTPLDPIPGDSDDPEPYAIILT
jgi:hypothetical protein